MLTRIISSVVLAFSLVLLSGCKGGVLDPKGQVGVEEKQLIIFATLIMLLVVIPVIVMTLYFAWKYREGRDHEIYDPKWAHSTKIEAVVWGIPILIIIVLGWKTWVTTHSLDPYKPLDHDRDPITVEVVSLNWKWLFIYPEQGIATVNELAFPKDVPIEFRITAQTTMNSFFIPQLGSQIYSMAGMETKLHLIANEAGVFDGFSANYSGEGFSGMKFKATATETDAEFEAWVAKVKQSPKALNTETYEELKEPTEFHPVEYYGQVKSDMFYDIIMQYMKDHGAVDYYEKPDNAVEGDTNRPSRVESSEHQPATQE